MAKLSDSAINLIVEAVEKMKYGKVTITINEERSSMVQIEIAESLRVNVGQSEEKQLCQNNIRHEG